ncbi:PhoD-like phosphatase-domain-containing protein [Fusarium flagelliforme]|uniref:Alkaline phosphatase n=1 Tax=Fusarium flagelliforme TaxID=2675880 RepID=A0A395MBB8_9HYPO|nr:PhoD-like phosphatase-domain-containing protein [Fusarium flagelliforme]KAH7188274.1 PhoD-like phosphatase-domain-containing protein [Fusarium flagelliforme]RFN45185.1 alkaline phosphatase [Fusarium flagelliforme]
MKTAAVLYVCGLLATAVTAEFDGNLNYASPSRRHARLGIDVPLVKRRSMKRGNTPYEASQLNFTHGVASGDPWPESVILWTRVAPSLKSDSSNKTVDGTAGLYSHETEKYIKADSNPICVNWKVFDAKPSDSGSVVSSGRAYTTSDIDYTIKVEAEGLKPLTEYYYQFSICDSDNKSPVGRTKTAPTADDDVSELSFAVFSCSNYPNGYFNAYGNAARKDEHDYVIHLGDYIYEYGVKGERASQPVDEIFTLHDYRTRHGQYRTDPDLQLLSRDFAWIPTWDDHEFANNGYRDGFSGLNNTEESFIKKGKVSVDSRKVNAVRAYFEWMPIRQTDMDDGLRVWRSFKMGKLLDLIILDTRNYDRSITSLDWNDGYIDLIRDDPSRTLMGSRQENWFYKSLSESKDRGAAWRIIGNQIIFSRITENYGSGEILSGDNWSGYVANRNRTLEHLYSNDISNNVFLAGDSHQNWVSDLVWLGTKEYDNKTGAGSIGVEFAGTAVSSNGIDGPIEPAAGDAARSRIEKNPELQWQEGYYRGYFILDVNAKQVSSRFYGSPSVATRNSFDIPLANFTVVSGENHLKRPVAGGRAESGALRYGEIIHTNFTLNTDTGVWNETKFENMYVKHSE